MPISHCLQGFQNPIQQQFYMARCRVRTADIKLRISNHSHSPNEERKVITEIGKKRSPPFLSRLKVMSCFLILTFQPNDFTMPGRSLIKAKYYLVGARK